ncbi:MAG: methylcrotonoyl-CoA carboxylase [Deltaproteobacteria bacterium]|nr:methylcrotonoyl-CoA carboxylase [Deltaproteobacteria bacterium]
MPPLPSAHDPASPEAGARAAHMATLLAQLRADLRAARDDRSAKALARHREQGKLTAVERLDRLLDPGTPFLEVGALAAHGLYEGGVHKAGTLAGIGVIAGRECVVSSNDAMVKGGTIYPMGVKKALRMQTIAMENRLPFVSLVDSGGAYLPLQSEVFPDIDDGGRIFYNQALMSKLGIAQVTAVMGLCTAGAAYIPAMSDEVVQVRGTGAIFLGGPPLVKAATGEEVSAEDLGGADVHAVHSGVTDHVASDDAEAIRIVRELVACLPAPAAGWIDRAPAEAPLYDPAEIDGIVPESLAQPLDPREIIARVVDASDFLEFKASYGPTLVCGTARIHGYRVGILANHGVLFSECAQKATQFIQLCEKRRAPLLFLQNVPGFIIGRDYERAGITKHGHQMVNAVATATVPKLTVIVGGSFGAGNYAMCGRAYGPRFLWCWPNAKIGVMGAEQAAGVLISVANGQRERLGMGPMPVEEEAMIRGPVLENQAREGSAWYSTANLWDDGIIEPARTRDVIGLCLAACDRAPDPGFASAFGTFRM